MSLFATPDGKAKVTYSYDAMGRRAAKVTDANGNVVSRRDYLPFGEQIDPWIGPRNQRWNDAENGSHKFTGQERDAEVGMDFFQARYYSSVLGRFTSADPGNAGADLTNPQSWNGYAYVSGNPLANVDPTGQDGEGFWNSIGNFFSNLFGSGGCNADFCATGYSGPTIDPQNNAQGDLSFGLSGEFSSGSSYYQSGVTFFAQATAYKPVQTQSATVAPQKNDRPPLFVPIDVLKWIPPIHPNFCSGGAFALIGNSFKLFGPKAGAYAIPAQYDSKDGGSSGFLVEVEVPHTPIAFAYEGSVSWRTGKYSNSGLALAGSEGTSVKLGAVNAGGFVDVHGNVGAYGSEGIWGGGGYGKFSLTGDCQ